ncbi:hypothetical protein GCM10029964_047080 [Kibdelosporangium lantanae]
MSSGPNGGPNGTAPKVTGERATPARRAGAGGGMSFGPGRMMGGGQAEKALDFKGSGLRLLRMLNPHRVLLWSLLTLGVISVALSVVGPKVLGQATDLIFAGIIGKSLPANLTKDQIVAGLRAQGDNTKADMLASIDLVPGQGIDFTAVGHVLLWVLGLYFLSSVFAYVQGYLTTTVVQRAVFTMREQVEESSRGCRCGTSTSSRVVRCSAASPTTSTTSPSRCSRP